MQYAGLLQVSRINLEPIQWERPTMARVDGFYIQADQSFNAGVHFKWVIDQRVSGRFVGIDQQVAAKQVAAAGQDTDRTLRVPRKIKNFGFEAIFG